MIRTFQRFAGNRPDPLRTRNGTDQSKRRREQTDGKRFNGARQRAWNCFPCRQTRSRTEGNLPVFLQIRRNVCSFSILPAHSKVGDFQRELSKQRGVANRITFRIARVRFRQIIRRLTEYEHSFVQICNEKIAVNVQIKLLKKKKIKKSFLRNLKKETRFEIILFTSNGIRRFPVNTQHWLSYVTKTRCQLSLLQRVSRGVRLKCDETMIRPTRERPRFAH